MSILEYSDEDPIILCPCHSGLPITSMAIRQDSVTYLCEQCVSPHNIETIKPPDLCEQCVSPHKVETPEPGSSEPSQAATSYKSTFSVYTATTQNKSISNGLPFSISEIGKNFSAHSYVSVPSFNGNMLFGSFN